MANVLATRMQNLRLNGGGSVEPRYHHYCYICNTQLNSCKQALLHCNGKRHKKKLMFLQARKHSIGNSVNGTIGVTPPLNAFPLLDHSSNNFPQPPNSNTFPAVFDNRIRNLTNFPPPSMSICHSHPPQLLPSAPPPTIHQANGAGQCFNGAVFHNGPPPMPAAFPNNNSNNKVVLSPATMAGTKNWLHPYQSVPFVPHAPQNMLRTPAPGYYHQPRSDQGAPGVGLVPPLPLSTVPQGFATNSNAASPAGLSTETGGSCYFSGVASPSDTSSLSSTGVRIVDGYQCHGCPMQFPNQAQLRGHLQTVKHHAKFNQQQRSPHRLIDCAQLQQNADLSETDSSSSVYYCSVCNVIVSSASQWESHNAGVKHKQRMSNKQEEPLLSRSSSTSSEPLGEIVLDSGYVSGSADEVFLLLLPPTLQKPRARFRCQLCAVTLNSLNDAQRHLKSPKHQLKCLAPRPFCRRKTSGNLRKVGSDTVEGTNQMNY